MTEPGSREFQVFVKPVGPRCNMDCAYCYYLDKQVLFGEDPRSRMPDILLEEYIVQHIEASTEPVIQFSWHGGEPTLLGLETFKRIVAIQQAHKPGDRQIVNGIQTNGTLLDQQWCNFLAANRFVVGISLDGPQRFHDHFRRNRHGESTFSRTLDAFRMLSERGIRPEILCVVSSRNVHDPLELYRFFTELGAGFITFLPLVERSSLTAAGVTDRSVPAKAFGKFLCSIFDEWMQHHIGILKVQIFEEALRSAFKQDHTLCIFKRVCGGVPVVEHNGGFYSCDHYVDREHYLGNILERPLSEMLDDPLQKAFGKAKRDELPSVCLGCEVREMCNGECPKNRFIRSDEGEPGLNYLCAGYRQFFNHIRPFAGDVAALWRTQG